MTDITEWSNEVPDQNEATPLMGQFYYSSHQSEQELLSVILDAAYLYLFMSFNMKTLRKTKAYLIQWEKKNHTSFEMSGAIYVVMSWCYTP